MPVRARPCRRRTPPAPQPVRQRRRRQIDRHRDDGNSIGSVQSRAAPSSLKQRANPSHADRASRGTLRKPPFAVFNPDRTRPSTALDGTELDAPFRRSLFLRNRFLARITVTTRRHDRRAARRRRDACRPPNWIWTQPKSQPMSFAKLERAPRTCADEPAASAATTAMTPPPLRLEFNRAGPGLAWRLVVSA